jgi:hypothetical protein
MVSLSNTTSIKNSNEIFIVATFNENTWEVIHVIVIYKLLKMQVFYFIFIFKNIFQNLPTNCPIIIIRDFNLYMLIR